MASSDGDFVEYLRRLGRQVEAGLADHPEPETLLAYYRGELDEAAADAIVEHITFCRSCADLVLAIPAFLAEDREPDHNAEESGPTGPVVPFPARETARRWHWLPLAAGLVVGLGVGYGSGRLGTPEPGASFLVGVYEQGPAEARGDEPGPVVLDFRSGRRSVVAVLTPPGRLGQGPFRGRVTTLTGHKLLDELGLEPTAVGTFVLVVERGALPAGELAAEITTEADGTVVGRWQLQVLLDP